MDDQCSLIEGPICGRIYSENISVFLWLRSFSCLHCGKILTAPGQSPCIGVVINSIVDDIGISLTTVTGLYLVATTTSAIALSRMGKVIDRVGVRIMVTVIALLLGVACFVASVARNVGVLLLAFFSFTVLWTGFIDDGFQNYH